MKTIAIIVEYNPFHNGHQYQIEQAKKMTGAEQVIVCMSGNYVQRGAPAVMDKYTRTKMALSCGVDLVIELPLYYACSSAEYFAKGAVSLLHQLGVVDYLVFGSECGDCQLLTDIATLLLHPTESFEANLKAYIKEGLSYPKARALALKDIVSKYSSESCTSDSQDVDSIEEVISSPNNILGIEYIKALLSLKSSITPVTIKRLGADYHDDTLSSIHSSAKAIRNTLVQHSSNSFTNSQMVDTNPAALLTELKQQVPETVYTLLVESYQKSFPVYSDDLSHLLHYKLLLEYTEGYERYVDISSNLSDRIKSKLPAYQSFEQFCSLIKSKDVTYTRISRCLLHILLHMTKENMQQYTSGNLTPYARMLGFKKESALLLSAIKKNSTIPLLSKLADAEKVLSQISETTYAVSMLREEINASHIYNSIVTHKFAPDTILKNEYEQQMIVC